MIKLKPTYIVERVTDINLEDLKADNIKGLIFDLDNTLMHPKTSYLPEDIEKWLGSVKCDFKIAILSNNPYTHYVKEAGERVGCVAYERAAKPRRKAAIRALKDLDLLPGEVVIIGDRPLTDIWVGQRLGMVTILVDPLLKHEEVWIIRYLRKLERIFIAKASKAFTQPKEK